MSRRKPDPSRDFLALSEVPLHLTRHWGILLRGGSSIDKKDHVEAVAGNRYKECAWRKFVIHGSDHSHRVRFLQPFSSSSCCRPSKIDCEERKPGRCKRGLPRIWRRRSHQKCAAASDVTTRRRYCPERTLIERKSTNHHLFSIHLPQYLAHWIASH